MSGKLKNFLSEEERARLADNGITILHDDEMELVSGGTDFYLSLESSLKKGYSTITYQSVICSSMMSSYQIHYSIDGHEEYSDSNVQ